jgi:hypothetical protein
MNPAEAKIRQVRPKLSTVAPLTSLICWGYAVINVALGLGLFFLYNTPVPIAIANILSYQGWGTIFFLLGLLAIRGLLVNNWNFVRHLQMAGLVVKLIWLIALIFRCFIAPASIVITLVWLFFAYIQAAVYIHFIPNDLGEVDDK